MDKKKFYYLYYAGYMLGEFKEKRRQGAVDCKTESSFLSTSKMHKKTIQNLLNFLYTNKDINTVVYYKVLSKINKDAVIIGLADINDYYDKIGHGFIIYESKIN